MARSPDSARRVLAALAAYNVIQHLVPDRGYVPANVGVAVALVVEGRRAGLSWREIGLGPDEVGPGLAWGSAVAAAVGAAAAVAGEMPAVRHWLLDDRARGHRPAAVRYQTLIRFPIGTALFEEVAFRGVLDGLWRRRGARAARVVTAVAFGAWHLLPTFVLYPGMAVGRGRAAVADRMAAALGGAAVTGIAGLGFTWLRERSGSVAAPWLAHAAVNSLSFLAARRAWAQAERSPGDG
jgi:membrane protease YdiL (CAAX protease family)